MIVRPMLLGVFLLGCAGGTPSATGDLAGRDLSGTSSSTGVICGGTAAQPTRCTAPADICCSSNEGQSGSCVAVAANCPTGIPYRCDSPAECPSGQVCCQTESGGNSTGSSCMDATDCNNQGGVMLCGKESDCGAGLVCCSFTPVGQGAGYMKCESGACPL